MERGSVDPWDDFQNLNKKTHVLVLTPTRYHPDFLVAGYPKKATVCWWMFCFPWTAKLGEKNRNPHVDWKCGEESGARGAFQNLLMCIHHPWICLIMSTSSDFFSWEQCTWGRWIPNSCFEPQAPFHPRRTTYTSNAPPFLCQGILHYKLCKPYRANPSYN